MEKHFDIGQKATQIVNLIQDENGKAASTLEYEALFQQMLKFGKNVSEEDDFKTVNQKFLNHMIGFMSQNTSKIKLEELKSSILDVLIAGVADKIFYTQIDDSFILDFRLNVGCDPQQTLFLVAPFHIREVEKNGQKYTEITLRTCYPLSISTNKLKNNYDAAYALDNPLNSMSYINRYIMALPSENTGQYQNMIAEFVKTLTEKGNDYLDQVSAKATTEEEKKNINIIQMSQFEIIGSEKLKSKERAINFCKALLYVLGEKGFDLVNNGFTEGELEIIRCLSVFAVSDHSIFFKLALNLLNDGRPTFLEISPIDDPIGDIREFFSDIAAVC